MSADSKTQNLTIAPGLKIMAIASAGGHWIQLMRLTPAFKNHTVIFISINPAFADTVSNSEFYSVTDANRWSKLKLIKMAYELYKLITAIKPGVIVSTGAAPGLAGIVIGKVAGAKTIWIDSIANVERLSLSGKIATIFADRVYTQWPHLQTTKVKFNGNVMS